MPTAAEEVTPQEPPASGDIPGTQEGEGTAKAKGRNANANGAAAFEVGANDGTYTKEQVDALLAAVRKEEKDKLYPQIEDMKGELKTLTKERDERLKAEAKAAEEAEAAEAKRLKDEMDLRTRFETSEQEWQNRFKQMENELETRDAILAKEREYSVLQSYINQRRAEMVEEILPELMDLVGYGCSTQEEVEASIASAKARTDAIMANITTAQQQQRMQQRGTSVTMPPVEPTENSPTHMTFTPAQIAAMSPAEFAKYREPLLRSTSPRNRGA